MADPVRAAVTAHYDERAATYDDNEMHRGLAAAVARFAGPVRGLVVDVATGTGLVLRELAGGSGRLLGVDLSQRMLTVARAALPSAAWARADAAALPVPDASVDLLTCVTALHLFRDPSAVVVEWRRVLASGGRIVTATFGPPGAGAGAPPPRDFPRRHDLYRSPELVAALFAGQGIRLTRHEHWTDASGTDRLVLCELS